MKLAARLVLVALLFGASVCAQSGDEGSIEGTVADPSGAVIPGVSLRAREVNTSATYSAATDDRGFFRFLVLPLGTYELVAQREGFATLTHKEVVVTVGARISLLLTLRLMSQTQRVVVSSETPLVEPGRTHVASTVEGRSLASLPVNGRNFNDFILLTPGVVRAPGGFQSFGGQRSGNLMLLDGAENENSFFGGAFLTVPYQFSLEAVQEFQVNTVGYPAELGRAANGIVNVATKSGTNGFHGDLFWYFRDRSLNANDLITKNLGQPRDPLHVHQFGGTLAGPILKNRLFFFANYDGQRRKERNETFLNLSSGFALSADPTVAAFQQRALDYLTPRAAPWLRTFDQDISFVRLDWRISPSQLLSGRWNRNHFVGENLTNAGPQQSYEHTGSASKDNDTLAVSLTSSMSSTLTNVARFSYLADVEPNQSNSINPQANIFEGGQQVLVIGRAVANPQRSSIRQFEGSDTLSLSRGPHAFKFGINTLVARMTWIHAPSFSGNYRFNSLESFGRSLAGVPAPQTGETFTQAFSGQGQPGATMHPNSTELAVFAQDEWRARPDLTFNFGLRYDLQWMARPGIKNPSPALAAAGLDTAFVPFDPNNLGPRFGFAWSPLRSQRLIVRGAYGLFYDWTRAGLASRTHYQNGISVETRSFTGAVIPAYPNTLCGPPDPSGLPPSCPPAAAGADIIMLFSPDYVQAYDQHASFGFEYQLQNNWGISAGYLMVRGTHMQRWRDINLPAPLATNIGIAGTNDKLTFLRFPLARPIAGFDRILALESGANSTYHALAVQLNKRFSHNFQFLAAYTLGKVMDDRPESVIFNPGGGAEVLLLSNPSNPGADLGPGELDARQRFVVSGDWVLNHAHRLHGPAKVLLDGWELSGILAAQSGFPYSGLVNFDLNNDGNPFTDRRPGQPRNIFRLPATVSLDPRLTRNMAFKDKVRLQLFWEAFNVFNRANITGVRTTQYSRSTAAAVCGIAATPCLAPQIRGSNAFGAPAATLGPRVMQVALKLLF